MNPPRLLFLHGFGENHQVWDDFLLNFEWKNAIHCPNYSDWTDCPTLEDYAVKIMSNLPDQSTFYVLAHSMGGYIALELAKLFPDQIVKVVMLNSSALPDSDQKKLNRDKTVQFLQNFGTKKYNIPTSDTGITVKNSRIEHAPIAAKFIRVTIRSIGNCPDWHLGAGNPTWLFLDEIQIIVLIFLWNKVLN